VLNLLLRSLVSKKPLSETLLKLDPVPTPNPNLSLDQLILTSIESLLLEDIMNEEEEEKIVVKLTVSVSKDIVCYAEAGEDFVNLLFSFLTVPLGFILKHLRDASFKGCIDQLYNSIKDLDEQHLKSNYHKEILLSPKIYPGFCYENRLLGMEDGPVASYLYAYWKDDEGLPLKLKHDKSPQGYLKGSTVFMVTDDLFITPISPAFGFYKLNRLKVPLTDIKEETVQVGKKEALRLLVAAFLRDSALTDVFIRQMNQEEGYRSKFFFFFFLQSMADKSTNSIELKVLVDKGSNKVIFIEPDNDFVDVLFSLLTIPMGTIIRLARKHSDAVAIGCMNNLYASVENFDDQEFWMHTCKDMLLHPRNAADSQCNALKLKLDDAEPRRYFMCPNFCKVLSYYVIWGCRCCPSSISWERSLSFRASQDGSVFVKGQTRFTVTDDLQVIPPSSSANSVFTKLRVMDVDAMEELTINIGTVEILNLLMCSLVSKTPLTETLLKPKQDLKSSSTILTQAIHIESQMSGDSMNDEEDKICLNLVVSKSKKMVCYAEAGEDFVNLLFSFLTLPLGFIVKNMKSSSLKGCIRHLYKTIQDSDGEYMISDHHKEMLLDPKLVPGFCYKNSLLGIEETSYYYSSKTLATDRSLFSSEPCKLKVVRSDSVDLNAQGFLKRPAKFVVTDNLVVRPISRILELQVLKDLNVPVTDIEDQIVHVGKKEVLHLLLASFLCDSALTNTFIADLREPKQEQ
ncbi:unnamed protein product, partial [Prunus brigantina]